jgi:RimJ/RimL family protein N-acetyltransferase
MESDKHKLKDDHVLLIRTAAVEDARTLLDYVRSISGESDFLSFGPGEFDLTIAQEEEFLRQCLLSDNQSYLLGLIGETIVATLSFSGGHRPRIRHSGELSMAVKKQYWGLGIGSLMLDAFIAWAKATQIITKINLRVRTDNRRALQLYEHKGFEIEGTISREMFLNGKHFAHHWLGIEI